MGKATYHIKEERQEVVLRMNRPIEEEIVDLLKRSGFSYTPRFRSWKANVSETTVALAKLICQKDEERQEVATYPVSENVIEALLDIDEDDKQEKAAAKLQPVIKEELESVLGAYIESQRRGEIADADLQALKESHQKEFDAIKLQKKIADMDQNAIYQALTTYMRTEGKYLIGGKNLSVLRHDEKFYSLSDRVESRFRSVLEKAGLPEWVEVEFRVNNDIVNEMEKVPDGVSLKSVSSDLTIFDNRGFNALDACKEKAIRMYVEDEPIAIIAKRLGTTEEFVYEILAMSLKDGNNALFEHITPMVVEAVRERYESGNDSVEAIATETGIREDVVGVVMLFLNKE